MSAETVLRHIDAEAIARDTLAFVEVKSETGREGPGSIFLAELLERPTETALAHVVLLRCALSKGSAREAERHAETLRNPNMTAVATHVRRAAEHLLSTMKGIPRGARIR